MTPIDESMIPIFTRRNSQRQPQVAELESVVESQAQQILRLDQAAGGAEHLRKREAELVSAPASQPASNCDAGGDVGMGRDKNGP
eukprot:COSAG01_NODE_3183_length_6447_cov_3.930687_8_plen_85_part_00